MRILVVFSLLYSLSTSAVDKLVLINGGHEPSSNYATHVENMFSFKNAFPGVSTSYFNASGSDALVVPFDSSGSYKRHSNGQIYFEPFHISGDVKPATPSELKRGFDSFKNSKDLFVYWGDHGGKGKICLWENVGYTPKNVKDLYSSIPKTSRIRSFHDHCYGSSAMVDEERVIPSKLEEWDKYLEKYFPKNHCGLAVARHDEVGAYIGWAKAAKDSPWVEIFKDSTISFNGVKNALSKLSPSFPQLTTDYLIEDLVKFFCAKREISTHLEVTTTQRQTGGVSCEDASDSTEYKDAENAFENERELTNEKNWIVSELKGRFLRETFPDAYKKYTEQNGKLEKIKSEVVLLKVNHPDDQKRLKELEAELLKARTDDINHYDELYVNVGKGNIKHKEWQDFFHKEGWKRVQEASFATSYKLLVPGKTITEDYFKQDPVGINNYAEADIKQKERQKVGMKRQEVRRSFIEAKLKEDGNEKIKEVYDEIRKCEMAPLR